MNAWFPMMCISAAVLAVSAGSQTPSDSESVPAPSNVRGKAYPRIHPDLRVTFRVIAPNAKEVSVAPRGSGFGSKPIPMNRGNDGAWTVTTAPVTPGFHYY